MRRYNPKYQDDSDFTTNANSYLKELARKNKLIELLAKRIWDYETKLDITLEELQTELDDYIQIVDGRIKIIDDKIGEGFNQEINQLLVTWLDDGTLDHIINETIFSWKVDQTEFDDAMNSVNQDLAHKSNFGEIPNVDSNNEVEYIQNGNLYVGMDREGYLFRAMSNNRLVRSKNPYDSDSNWELITGETRTGPSYVRQLDNGELLIATAGTSTQKSALYLTRGYLTGNVTVELVLEVSDYTQSMSLSWGFGGSDNIYTVSEYDTAIHDDRGVNQKVYLTTDFGKTWTTIFNHGISGKTGRHIHGAFYDKYRQAIWVTTGDGASNFHENASSIRVSWDMGQTWEIVSNRVQPTTIYVFPDSVIFVSDNTPNGVYRLNNPSKDNLSLEIAYKFNDDIFLSNVGQGWYKRDNKSPLIIPVTRAGGTDNSSFLLGTYDGQSFFKIWENFNSSLDRVTNFYGPLSDGSYIGSSSSQLNVKINNYEQSLIGGLFRAIKNLNTLIPKRSYESYRTSTSFSVNDSTWTTFPLERKDNPTVAQNRRFNYSNLFDLNEAGTGVIFNREAIVRIETSVSPPFTLSNVSVRIQLNGNNLKGNQQIMQTAIETTIQVRKGSEIIPQVRQTSGDTVTLQGNDYALVIDGWETV